MADRGKVEMGAGDTDPIRRRHFQSALPRRDGLLPIDVEHRSGLGGRAEGGLLEPLAFGVVDPDDEIERGLERPVITRVTRASPTTRW